jgi:predicted HTH transcriptional regulator
MGNDEQKTRIFVSSVQKELALERAAIAQLVSVDPFLARHCEVILYENVPPSGKPDQKAYLACLKSCQIYALLLDVEYGQPAGELSATHEEYRLAQLQQMPSLIFLKGVDGKKDGAREPNTKEFISEIKRDGYKYIRFHDREDLKPLLRAALYSVLNKSFKIAPDFEETEEGNHQIDVASPFETVLMPDLTCEVLDKESVWPLVEAVIKKPAMRIWDDSPEHALVTRGLAIRRADAPAIANRAAAVLFHLHPGQLFPQCEILADAFDEPKTSGKPKGQETIDAPLLRAVEQALAFIDKHTFHPRRVVGLNNLRLDEYPVQALREVLINALAHRNYEDATRKVILRVFSDRIEIASPGYPLRPLTLARLQRGNYRPCSRNPVITQTLALLDQMEQRGTGFARMRDAMLDHGLDAPGLSQGDGYFVVTLRGPNGDYDRLKLPANAAGPITPAIEAQLNDRQKAIILEAQKTGAVTSGWCRTTLKISRDTANRDLSGLVDLGLLSAIGKARSTRYVLASPSK